MNGFDVAGHEPLTHKVRHKTERLLVLEHAIHLIPQFHTKSPLPRESPSPDEDARDPYRKKILQTFATRAFRRPVDDETLGRLVAIARQVDKQPNNSFEDGIAMAIKAILVSPRFLLRAEIQPEPDNPGK
ncbi:DUF1595 domain-containing protein, partial [bacterium]|nr:DUF1595 domain-containing protein [bacterium]